jgi:hypothetical protein
VLKGREGSNVVLPVCIAALDGTILALFPLMPHIFPSESQQFSQHLSRMAVQGCAGDVDHNCGP